MLYTKSKLFVLCFGIFLALGLFTASGVKAQTATPTAATYVTNGAVRGSAIGSDGSTYIGGDFTYVGPNNGNGMPLNTSTGAVDANFPKVNGTINAVVSDGSNGWFIGGSFTKVGSTTRNNLAKITKSGSTYTVDSSWDPNPNGAVNALERSSTTLYVGGNFTSIGGQTRNRLAALSTSSTGAADASWNPNVNNIVRVIKVVSSKVHVGGDFTDVNNGTTRNYFASFNVANASDAGTALNVNPNFNARVRAIESFVNSDFLLMGGDFTTMNGSAENYVGAWRISTNTSSTYNFSTNGPVYAIKLRAVSCNDFIFGGDFTSVTGANGTFTRNGIARARSTQNVTDLDANVTGGIVQSFGLTGTGATTIFIGGTFTGVSDVTRNYVAQINVNEDTGQACSSITNMGGGGETSWNPLINNEGSNAVNALALNGSDVFTAGIFSSIGGSTRNRLAKIGTNGTVDASWDPNAGGAVNAIAVDSTSNTTAIYAGGAFTTIGGTTRNRLAKIGTSGSGTLDASWDPNAGGAVNAVTVNGSTIYVGGAFTTVNSSTTRNRIAALNNTDGTASSWDPNAGGAVNTIVVSGSDVYAGGAFTTVNGATTRNRLAAFTTASATATSWNPNANGTVNALAVSGSNVYAAGAFTALGATTRNYFAKIGTNGTLDSSWDPNGSGGTAGNALVINSNGDTAYVGGDFTAIGGTTRNRLAAIGTSGAGSLRSWDPNMSAGVLTIASNNSALYAGGSFTTTGGNAQNYFSAFAMPTASIAVDPSSFSENGGTSTITATISAASAADVVVNLAFSGAATLATDYSTSSSSITVTAGNTTATATLTGLNDATYESNEGITLDVDTVTGGTESGTQQVSMTLTEDDAAPTITISVNNSSISNTGGSATITATRSFSWAGTTTVWLSYSGTASGAGSDYNSDGSIAITSGNTTGTATISAVSDAVDEDDETVIVDVSSVTNGTETGTQQVTVTITDDDPTPTLSFSVISSAQAESLSPAWDAVTATLSAATSRDVVVNYSITGATTHTTDWMTRTNFDAYFSPFPALVSGSSTRTITAGSTSTTFSGITVTDDSLDENDETFVYTMTSVNNGYATLVSGNDVYTYTIQDNDASPTVTLSANNASISETGGSSTLTATLSAASGRDVTVNLAYGGTAVLNTDYGLAASITITAGNTTGTTTLTATSDTTDENDETAIVDISSITGGTETGTQQVTVTITDDDEVPTVAFSSATGSGNENVTPGTATVTLAAASAKTVTVAYATANSTAASGSDYTATSGTLTFNAGETSKTVSVVIANDSLDETSETFTITLANPSNATLGTAVHTFTIVDDDGGPTIGFNLSSSSGAEGTASPTVTISLNSASGLNTSVDYAVTGGTATGSGTDYTLAAGTATITAGSTSTEITLSVVGDALDEVNETVIITLSNAVNADLGVATHTFTITDDDNSPTIRFSAASSSGLEATAGPTVTVSIDAVSAQNASVQYAVTGGTATGSGTDYTLAAGTATITAGTTSTVITLSVVGDLIDEANETVIITLSNPVNALLGTAIHTYTITDDDVTPTVQFSSATGSGNENVTPAVITVTLSDAPGQTTTVAYATANGTALSGSDYMPASGTLTFSPGQTSKTINVTILNDSLDESGEVFTITLSNPTNSLAGSLMVHTFTIADDESMTVTGGIPNGQTNVPLEAQIDLLFSQAIDAASVTASTITLKPTSNPSAPNLCTDVTISSATRVICLHDALSPSTSYTLTATTGVRKSSGSVALSTNVVRSFTTSGVSSSLNTTPPIIINSYPAPGAVGVPPNAKFNINFSLGAEGNMKTGSTTIGSIQNPAYITVQEVVSGVPSGTDFCGLSGCTITWDATARVATIDPIDLLAGRSYRLTVLGSSSGVKNTSEIPLSSSFIVNFSVGAATDSLAPTVKRTCGSSQTDTCVTPVSGATVSRFAPEFTMTFSEALDPASLIVGTTVGLYRDVDSSSTQNNAETLLSSSALSLLSSSTQGLVRFGNTASLAAGARYCFFALGGAVGVKDTSGNVLANNFENACFTTDATADITYPKLVFAEADNFKLVARFSETLNAADAVIPLYYTLECPIGITVPLSGKTFTYRPEAKEVEVQGLGLEPGQSCRLTIQSDLRDAAGNPFDASENVANFVILNTATTGGFLGSTAVQSNTFFGGMGGTAATFWEKPQRCEPRSRATNQTTVVECEFPVPQALTTGAQLILSFPSGFTVTNAADTPASQSAKNADLNGLGSGVTTISGIVNSNSAGSVTLTIVHNSTCAGCAAMVAGDMIRFDLSGITTPTTPSIDQRITIAIKNSAGVKVGQTIQPAPFSLNQSGALALSGSVYKDSNANGTKDSGEGLANLTVAVDQQGGFAVAGTSSAMMGHKEVTTGADGSFSVTGLTGGEYRIFLPAQTALFDANVAGAVMEQKVFLSSDSKTGVDFKFTSIIGTSAKTLTVNIANGPTNGGAGGEKVDVFCDAGQADVAFSAPSMKIVTLDASGTGSAALSLQANKTYRCGVGPHLAFEQLSSGGPPPVPTFNFMPPPSQNVTMSGDSQLTFALASASLSISGSVLDGSQNGVANVYVHASPGGGCFGTDGSSTACRGAFTQSKSDGTFTLNVAPGIYEVSAEAPGMPASTTETVSVKTTSVSGVTLKIAKQSLTITGQVLDESGNGIKYAHLSADRIASGGTCSSSTLIGGHADTPSDASGNYTVYVSAGTWCLHAFHPTYGEVGSKTVVVSDTSQAGQNLQATASSYKTISGTVLQNSTAVAGAFINCFAPGIGGNQAKSDAAGAYSMKVKSGTTYTCDGFAPGVGQLGRQTNVNASADVAVNFSVQSPGTVQVTIAGITDAFCDVRNSAGLGTGTGQNTNGVYSIFVSAGTYTVRCSAPKYGQLLEQAGVSVSAGSTAALSVVPPTTRTVTATVTDGTNNIEGVSLAFTDRTTNRSFIAKSGSQSSGANVSVSVADGSYIVFAAKQGYEQTSANVTVSAGSIILPALTLKQVSGVNGATVTATVRADDTAYTGNARVIATLGSGSTLKTVVADSDPTTGQASLPLPNGTWSIKAVGDNGKESTTVEVTVSNGSASGFPTLALANTISGFTAQKGSETFSLSAGGLLKFENLAVGDKVPEVSVPANTFSTTDTSTGKLDMRSDPTLKDIKTDSNRNFVGSSGYDITPKDANGNVIKDINGSVTITMPYTDDDVTAAGVVESKLQVASYNTSSQTWETFPTTVDTTNNLLTAQITHFSSFGVIGSVPTAVTSAGSSAAKASTEAPSPVSDLKAVSDGKKVTLTWKDPPEMSVTSLMIVKNGQLQAVTSISPGVKTYTDTNVTNGQTYTYVVRALTAAGTATDSSEISIKVGAGISVVLPPPAVVVPPASAVLRLRPLTLADIFGTPSASAMVVGQSGEYLSRTLPGISVPLRVGSHAYGAARVASLDIEQSNAKQLADHLHEVIGKAKFNRLFWKNADPSKGNKWWYTYVNAYVYGGYPLEAIKQGVRFGGKTVHPARPWSEWQNSADYQTYIDRK